MPLEPELEAIFNQDPRFKEVLQAYERTGTSDPRPDGGLKIDGVTDEALQAYLDRFYTHRNPQFRSGVGSPPPQGGMEDQVGPSGDATSGARDGTGGDGAGAGAGVGATTPGAGGLATGGGTSEGAPEGGQQAPAPVAPAGDGADPFRPPPGFDPQKLAAWQEFDRQLSNDPRLQQILYHYATRGEIPEDLVRPPSSRIPQPAPVVAAPDLTPPPDLDLADPATRALWDRMVASEQTHRQQIEQYNQHLQSLSTRVDESTQEFRSRVEAENDGLVARVRNSFAHEHGITEDEARRVQRVAENLGIAAQYMTGVDPITGLPVRPDPMAAATRAFEVAYSVDPIARETERQRFQAAEQARLQLEADRRRKLAGVGGGSGAAPHQPVEPSAMSEDQRRGAMVEYIRNHMNGTPEGERQ